jgi:hypothetical protein
MVNLSPKLPWEMANPKWASDLNPVLANPMLYGNLIPGVMLKSGDNVVNHGLQRKVKGYLILMNSAPVTFYDKQTSNQRPELTLTLNASGPTTVTLYVF